ncbi:ADP-ribosylglycohydrolase family protein [Paeniglutamicibacter antarcticus]|uniref:ADP-ribosylglycohydrolase family protein n=1 Tax=Arthrobacter terrae TaxID=2935737 RepID=A0A931G6W4_9MICC|nr:ADP-ribosylglycohydrolase family protein [Arthrobacter terrae]MBG0741493.1 ADP-ribosylglycohydrolase family protein [Arthrobacter terrae]
MEPSPAATLAAPVSFASRVQGALMGGALGDSFGYLVEADDVAAIRARFGSAGLLDLSQAPGPVHFSAATQLGLYTVDALVEALEWANDGTAADETAILWLAYLRWLSTQGVTPSANAPSPQPRWIDAQEALRHRRGADTACLSGLASGEMGTRGRPVNPGAKGSGSLCRSAPFGLVPHIPAEAVYTLSSNGAALTHGHALALQPTAAFSWLIHQLAVEALPLRAAAVSMRKRAGAETAASADLLDGLDVALELSTAAAREPAELSSALGTGADAGEALAIALYAVLVTEAAASSPVEHFLTAIRIAANLDGASSSTASVAGNILGALYGEDCLPQAWLSLSETPGLIRSMGQQLLKVTGSED